MIAKRILPAETEIIGCWLVVQGKLEADDAARRIDELVTSHLKALADSDDGWSRLYQDPSDGRYWELTYPDSASHGGGAPRLTAISRELVAACYKI